MCCCKLKIEFMDEVVPFLISYYIYIYELNLLYNLIQFTYSIPFIISNSSYICIIMYNIYNIRPSFRN